ncbi:hypothetical protein NDU88_002459 [Pleurodeles waltl]|uniref:Uncharacterized protein n=1 Tax=Pleurodeles waltl TaxID=8319 RepID=A0AAV7PFB8_PLEWA|nr:hypothetical protein NDU88_002459 [Pleurodeles waltl]
MTALQGGVASCKRARFASVISHDSSTEHNDGKDLGQVIKEHCSVTLWVEGKALREVVAQSRTRCLGQDKGKEVPKGGYGAEAQGCRYEDMDLVYMEDSPEEGEIV